MPRSLVDEGEINERPVEMGQRTLAGEELVTRRAHEVQVAQDLLDHLEKGVNPDRPGSRQGQASPGADTDLKVASRVQELVEALQQLMTEQRSGLS